MTDSTTPMTIELAHGNTATISQFTPPGGSVYTQVKFSNLQAGSTRDCLQALNVRFPEDATWFEKTGTFTVRGEHVADLGGIISGNTKDVGEKGGVTRPKPRASNPITPIKSLASQIEHHRSIGGGTSMGRLD